MGERNLVALLVSVLLLMIPVELPAEAPPIPVRMGMELEVDTRELAGSRAIEWIDFLQIERQRPDATAILSDADLETFLVDAANWRFLPKETQRAIGREAFESPTRPLSRLAALRQWRALSRDERIAIARLSRLPARARAIVLTHVPMGRVPLRRDLPAEVAGLVGRLNASLDTVGVFEFRHTAPRDSPESAIADLRQLWSYVVPVGSTRPPKDYHLHGSSDGEDRAAVARALNLLRGAQHLERGEVEGLFDNTSLVAFRDIRQKGLIRHLGGSRIELRDGGPDPEAEAEMLAGILRVSPAEALRALDADLSRSLTRERVGLLAGRSVQAAVQLRFHQAALPTSGVPWTDTDFWVALDRAPPRGTFRLDNTDRLLLLETMEPEGLSNPLVQRVLARWIGDWESDGILHALEECFLRPLRPGREAPRAVRAEVSDFDTVRTLIRSSRSNTPGGALARRILAVNFGLPSPLAVFNVIHGKPTDFDAALDLVDEGLRFAGDSSGRHGDVRRRSGELRSQMSRCQPTLPELAGRES